MGVNSDRVCQPQSQRYIKTPGLRVVSSSADRRPRQTSNSLHILHPWTPPFSTLSQSSTMQPFVPSASPYSNDLPPWHYDGSFDYSFHDDSGYASEDSEFVPSPSLYPNHIYKGSNQDHQDPPWKWRHQAPAFINAQWSPPMAPRACHLHRDSIDDSRRPHDLPQQLSFEQQYKYHESGHQQVPSTSHSHESFGRYLGHTPSWGNSEENISPLDIEEHKARIPDALPSLSKRIESEADESLSSSCSTQHSSPSPEAKPDVPRTRRSRKSTHPSYRTESSKRSLVEPPRRHQTTLSRDTQLGGAWQEHHHERMVLEKERRAPRRQRTGSLLQRKGRSRSSRRVCWDDVDGETPSRGHGGYRMANGEYAG